MRNILFLVIFISIVANCVFAMPAKSSAKKFPAFLAHVEEAIQYLTDQTNNVGSATCDGCKILMNGIQVVANSNMTDDEAVNFVGGLCTSIGIFPVDVCYYVMANMLPEMLYVYRDTEDTISIDNDCGFLVGATCIVADEFMPVFDWNISFPNPEPPYVPPTPPSPDAPKIRILHMSDTHYDNSYLEGTISNCNEPLCCRANRKSLQSEIYYAGKYGALNGSCDIPKLTLESMLEYAANNLEFDLVYWTGDIPPHDVWNQTKEGNIEMLQSTCSLVKQYFGDSNTVFPSCGNHEAEPVNSFPVPAVYQDYDIAYLYTQLDSVWTNFIPDIDHSTVLNGGYYAYDARPGLRVISLNMNYCHNGNWWLLVESQDPTDEIQWLIQQLDDAEQNNIKVHIIGHIPPGHCVYVWSRNYRDILERYKGTITGNFYGHTHNDEFEMIYDDVNTSSPISVAHIGPSVTTYSKLNPAFRIYTIDGDYSGSSWQVLDYEEYWLDINKANAAGVANWELLYSAKETYGLQDFSGASFDDLITRMETDDALFQIFYQNYNRVYNGDPCDLVCKRDMLCSLRRGWNGYSYPDCNYG